VDRQFQQFTNLLNGTPEKEPQISVRVSKPRLSSKKKSQKQSSTDKSLDRAISIREFLETTQNKEEPRSFNKENSYKETSLTQREEFSKMYRDTIDQLAQEYVG